MPVICYVDKRFSKDSLAIIETANQICLDYQNQGYDLTLRQLYYQFVARGYIANKDSEYKRLGSIINDARLAGLLDWDYIVDRTRFLRELPYWGSAQSILNASAQQFRLDKWRSQPHRVEVWIEKDALSGVIAGVCNELQVPYFACKGYTSQSEVWSAGQRLKEYSENEQEPIILHLGDHDPSGIDMSRDIEARLEMFAETPIEIWRLALNWDQVQQYNPPPNPAKQDDSRAKSYINRFGYDSWELDALEPSVISDLIRNAVNSILDQSNWDHMVKEEERHKQDIADAAGRWSDVQIFLDKLLKRQR